MQFREKPIQLFDREKFYRVWLGRNGENRKKKKMKPLETCTARASLYNNILHFKTVSSPRIYLVRITLQHPCVGPKEQRRSSFAVRPVIVLFTRKSWFRAYYRHFPDDLSSATSPDVTSEKLTTLQLPTELPGVYSHISNHFFAWLSRNIRFS